MIEFKNLSKRFDKKIVLDGISFKVDRGEIVFVLGRSGVGKSVLLKTIVGLLRPDSGEIFLDGREISRLKESELYDVRKRCGMIFQSPALLDSLNVYENLAFGLRAHRLIESEAAVRNRVRELLGLVQVSEKSLEKFPSELSFSVQKRISLARTLAIQPEYLLFDEPTTGLDPIATHAIDRLIQNLTKELNVASLVVSHDMESATEIANRIIMLDEGKIVAEGTPQELMQSRVPLVREFLKDVSREARA